MAGSSSMELGKMWALPEGLHWDIAAYWQAVRLLIHHDGGACVFCVSGQRASGQLHGEASLRSETGTTETSRLLEQVAHLRNVLLTWLSFLHVSGEDPVLTLGLATEALLKAPPRCLLHRDRVVRKHGVGAYWHSCHCHWGHGRRLRHGVKEVDSFSSIHKEPRYCTCTSKAV